MLIPYATDAPVYHRPAGTIALIAVNVMAFLYSVNAPEKAVGPRAVEAYYLELGGGLHPAQWVTANFLHAGFLHLALNMLFLWTFGLVVEGKLGWRLFLPVYLAIGVFAAMIVQIGSFACAPGFVLGASGAIYGLIGMALVWAPENDVQCLFAAGPQTRVFDVPIYVLAAIYLALQILGLALTGWKTSSELVHLLGAGIGFGLGYALLREGWVDCENWDLFSLMRGRNLSGAPPSAAEAEPTGDGQAAVLSDALAREKQRRDALEQIADLVRSGDMALALAAHERMGRAFPDWCLPEPVLYRLVHETFLNRQYGDPISLAVEYLRAYGEHAVRVRLTLAAAVLREQQRPAQARRVLAKLAGQALSPQEEAFRAKLEQEAARQIADGVLEETTEDW